MSTVESSSPLTRSDPLLTPREAALYARVTVGHLAQLRYLGRGPAYLNPTPRTILYRRSELDSWLFASERSSTVARRT